MEKVDWVARAIEYEATPKSIRDPKEKGDFIKSLDVPSSTYYDKISETETQEKIIKLCFKLAKKRTPDILEKLGEKAEAGNDASISQFMEYVLELKKKMELSGDKNNPVVVKHEISDDEFRSIIQNITGRTDADSQKSV